MTHTHATAGMMLPGSSFVILLAGLLALSLSGCGATTPAKEALTAEKPVVTGNSTEAATSTETARQAPTTTDTPAIETPAVDKATGEAQSAATEPAATTAPAETVAAPTEVAPTPSQAELNTQLWDAARAGDAATVASLLQSGADAQTATASGESALHAAVAAGSLASVRQLLSHGANVNAATSNGWTPLHHAARFSRPDIANFLLQNGADPKAVTNGTPAKTPVQMALDQGDLRTARILGY